ncbi:MAG TPA: MopE-related protein, partial [Myxococcota bacterium]|nr:MopE-related protein [Myxococcota bacterium]
DEGLSQACSITNAFGTCNGTETCSAGSWVGCNAKTPAAETCNNIDDNCDGRVDEDLSQACSVTNVHGTCTGTETCSAGNWVGCNAKTPVAETCNNIDDNCDGRVDEDLSRACSITNGFGTCNGTETCNAGNWEGCNAKTPAAETCNNIDDDCDGLTDEGLSQACSITNAFGTCNGTETCNAGSWVGCNAKTPIAEICNNIDDDCDGSTDENLLQACSVTNVHGTCTGTEMCNAGNWVGCTAKTPAAEICNNIDDNCDGLTDEDLGTTTCGLGVCHHTVQNCVNGVPQVCNPFHGRTTEVCDGLDNDCDGYTDEDLGTTTCGLGICHHTVQNCVNGVPQHCDPLEGRMIEVCDGYDNDCDGYTDEDLGTTTCGLGECRHTAPNCLNGVPQTCDPYLGMSPEICDGLDNDCDGDTDENLLNCQVLWVDQSNIGDPDENGSRLHPFTTIGKALAVSQDGTVIRVLEGTYPGGLTVEHPNIRIIGSGTDNTFVSSVAGATGFYVTGDNVTIQDMKVSGGRYGLEINGVTNGTFQNLTISTLTGATGQDAAGIVLNATSNITLSGLKISGVTGGVGNHVSCIGCVAPPGQPGVAVIVDASSSITISDGIFFDLRGGRGGRKSDQYSYWGGAGGRAVGVWIRNASSSIVVQNTATYNAYGGESGKGYSSIYCDPGGNGLGIVVESSSDVRATGSLIYDMLGGASCKNSTDYNYSGCVFTANNGAVLIDHLTCVGSGHIKQKGFWSSSGATIPIGVTNSIFAHLSDYCLWNDPSNDGGVLTVSYSNMFDCQAGVQSNANVMSNCLTSDPMFVNDDITAPDYHLLPSSPSIDTGKPNSDYCNEPYPNGCRVNMGAYGNTAEATSAQGAVHCSCESGPGGSKNASYDSVRALPANAAVTQLGPKTCDNMVVNMDVLGPVASINVGDVVVYGDAESELACRVTSVGTEQVSVAPQPNVFSPGLQSNSTQALPTGPTSIIISGVQVLLDEIF